MIIFHKASNLHDIIKDGCIRSKVNNESQSPAGPLDYVFFSTCKNDYMTKLYTSTIIFPSDVLIKYKWWTNTQHSIGLTSNSNIYNKGTDNIDAILRKLYNNSLKQIGYRWDPYDTKDIYSKTFAVFQEVFIKRSISLKYAIAIIVPAGFDTTLLKKKYPAIKIILA